MLQFVTSYTNQNKKRKQTLESAQYGLEIIFKLNSLLENLSYLSWNLDRISWFDSASLVKRV